MTPTAGRAGDVILADVGGTNVRFSVLKNGAPGPIAHLAVRDHATFAGALEKYLANQDDRAAIAEAIFAVAGVVEGERCALTNNAWVVDAAELRARFGFKGVRIINDFEAVAWALPNLDAGDVRRIGGRAPVEGAPMAVLGPGTGLGVAAYVPQGRRGFVIHSEGGHVTASSGSAREDAVIAVLRQRFGHVSAERLLSGPGLENIYRALALIDAVTVPERSAAAITGAALDATCAVSRAAVDMFCAMLGDAAGNVALGFGAKGGVYLAGGILSHIGGELPASQFRARFDAKGRMRGYVEPIPVYLVLHDDPAFIGLRVLALQSDPFT